MNPHYVPCGECGAVFARGGVNHHRRKVHGLDPQPVPTPVQVRSWDAGYAAALDDVVDALTAVRIPRYTARNVYRAIAALAGKGGA